jgi:hypothetical protein
MNGKGRETLKNVKNFSGKRHGFYFFVMNHVTLQDSAN